MKLYHGSPKKLKILIPFGAKGMNKFENQKVIFLCKTFNHAVLYAISKSLKGKTTFAIIPKKLFIVGKSHKPKTGYVYEVNVKKAKKGPREQYAYFNKIKEFKITKVYPKNYQNKIVYVNKKEDLLKNLKCFPSN